MEPEYTITGKPAEIREFSLAYETDKLRKILMLPLTNVVFDDRYAYGKLYLDENNDFITIYAKLYVNDEMIGTVPYYSDKWGPMYFKNRLDESVWQKVYQLFQPVIFDQIFKQQPLAATADVKDYASLNVRDKEGTIINTAYCNYVDNDWKLLLTDPNAVLQSKVIHIGITPPPPVDGK
jgi:hypothetical protein